jgi:hypothetical protein
MAEGLKIKIGADIVEVTQSLNDVERDIKQLSKEIKNLSGQALVDANKQLEVLNQRAQGLKNIGRSGFDQFGAAIQGAGRSAAGAVPALNSLSQVARDLPFGFIAIQNNLPIVIDQFTALSRSSGGLGPALKGLAGALVGPAGIAFAFGALVAGATSLIQKYGSLGAALDALTRSNDKYYIQQQQIAAVQKEASESAGELISRFNFLSQSATNANLSIIARKDAIKKLRDEYGAYLQNLTDEDILNGKLVGSINNVIAALRNKAIAQAAVGRAAKLEGENLVFLEKEKKLTEDINRLTNQPLKTSRQIIGQGTNTAGSADPAADIQRNIKALNKELEAIRLSRKANEDLTNTFYNLAQARSAAAGTGAIDASNKAALAGAKEAAAAAKQAAAAQKEQQKELAKAAAEAEKFRERVEAIRNELSQLRPIVIPIRTKAEITEINPRFLTTDIAGNVVELPVKVKPVLDLAGLSAAPGLDKFKLPTFSPDVTGFKLYQDQLIKLGQTSQQIGGITKTLFDSFAASNKNFTTSAIDNFNALNERVSGVAQQFNQFLAPAIDTVFGALQNGTSIPKALGQAFKALIAQLAITVVKAAALAAILSLIPGAAPLLGVAGGAGGAGGFGKLFGSLLGFSGKQTAAPTFGNLQPGGLQLAGGVALTLRGTDLVGAISGANARINRVG